MEGEKNSGLLTFFLYSCSAAATTSMTTQIKYSDYNCKKARNGEESSDVDIQSIVKRQRCHVSSWFSRFVSHPKLDSQSFFLPTFLHPLSFFPDFNAKIQFSRSKNVNFSLCLFSSRFFTSGKNWLCRVSALKPLFLLIFLHFKFFYDRQCHSHIPWNLNIKSFSILFTRKFPIDFYLHTSELKILLESNGESCEYNYICLLWKQIYRKRRGTRRGAGTLLRLTKFSPSGCSRSRLLSRMRVFNKHLR